MRICEWLSRTSTDGAGRRGLVAAHQLFAGLDEAERLRGVDAERLEHFGGEDLAHAALQRQPAVGGARPGGAAAALGAEVEQAAIGKIVHLGEEEAATVAELRIVGAELVAVVAQRQRFREAAGQGNEAAEMLDPLGVRQAVEADAGGGALLRKRSMCSGKLAAATLSKSASPSEAWLTEGRKDEESGIKGSVAASRKARRLAKP